VQGWGYPASDNTDSPNDGTVCFSAGYYPYGAEMDYTTTCGTNYKFTGYERDSETGLDYAFARYYNARIGRFMSTDPQAGDIGDPQTLNRYAYVRNNPVNSTDPSGMADGGPSFDDSAWTNLGLGVEFGHAQQAFTLLNWDDTHGIPAVPKKPTPASPQAQGLPKCSSLGALGILAAGISYASQWTGTGYTLGLNGNALKAVVLGADTGASVALVSDPSGNVGIATSLSATPSAGSRFYGGGVIIGGSTYSSLSGYSSYSHVNFTTTFGYGLATGFTETSNSSGISTTAYVGYGLGGSMGGKGLGITNNVQAFCKQ
jgi:RHS repeat-associated protein